MTTMMEEHILRQDSPPSRRPMVAMMISMAPFAFQTRPENSGPSSGRDPPMVPCADVGTHYFTQSGDGNYNQRNQQQGGVGQIQDVDL